jgi:hypothetical protein
VRAALGCLALLIVAGALFVVVDRGTAALVHPAVQPWVAAAAALQFTLALGSAWTLGAGLVNRRGSRAAILERAAAGEVPDADGPIVVTGTVRPATAPLHAPITRTPCVAYSYRLFRQVRSSNGRLQDEPVYWGLASRPFILDTRRRAVRVMAVPWIVDDATRHASADAVQRARDYVGVTRFAVAPGVTGAIGSVLSTIRVLFTDEDGEHRADYRCADATARLEGVLLEETVLPVGATATVAGTWSVSRLAVVTADGAPGGVTATTGPVERLLAKGGVVPASAANAAAFTLVLAVVGAGMLWAAVTWLGPSSPHFAP